MQSVPLLYFTQFFKVPLFNLKQRQCIVFVHIQWCCSYEHCVKKTFKECISIPMAQVEGLLPLTPHPVPPSCWKVDKKGWDVFVISIVGCLWLSFGCLLVVFATYGLWVVYRRGGGCPPPLLLASVLGRGDRPNLNPTHLPPSTLNPQNHKSKSNEIGSDHPRYNKMIRS